MYINVIDFDPEFKPFRFQPTEQSEVQLAMVTAACKLYLKQRNFFKFSHNKTRQLVRELLKIGIACDQATSSDEHETHATQCAAVHAHSFVKERCNTYWKLLGMHYDNDHYNRKQQNFQNILECISTARKMILKPSPISAEVHTTLKYGYYYDHTFLISEKIHVHPLLSTSNNKPNDDDDQADEKLLSQHAGDDHIADQEPITAADHSSQHPLVSTNNDSPLAKQDAIEKGFFFFFFKKKQQQHIKLKQQ
ncbi:hypothetical protein RFI_26852 [Reticulomyxa filosa]|uniref:Uncharacterized protein n=1 Tax=Reticulomyxa filosa TaxID=46433 RepID=X6MBV0_RETFI|nr:hypothetical protein RFI_26852 [Reticulomyxa filosa]|eukprot:ETO10525.1 hypothetical protein RFI_26852 [Reticulomyxa filosa]